VKDAGGLPIWAVYDHPSDFPEEYVARKCVARAGSVEMTSEFMSSPDLELLRAMLEARGLVYLERMEGDAPVVLETWV
jgi:hypothetical protein